MEFTVPPAVGVGNTTMQQWIDASSNSGILCDDFSKQSHSGTNSSNAHVEDTSLTSLNWLPDFKIQSMDDSKNRGERNTSILTKSSASSIHSTDSSSSTGSWNGQESEIEKDECLVPLSPIKRCLSQTAEFEKNPLRFEENPNKPPFSYTTIIYLAIRSCSKEKVMLSDIYQWIKDHFKYYRIAESTWQNSVRHNLSLNQFFRKIPRGEGDPGKGSFWQINPEYEQLLSNDNELQRLVQQQISNKGPLQRKRSKTKKKGNSSASSSMANNAVSKHAQKQPFPNFSHTATHKRHCKIDQQRLMGTSSSLMPMTAVVDPCHIPGDLDWVSLLSSQKLGCVACHEAEHHCRPMFGSPVLGPTDLGHIGDPMSCSPAILPISLQNKIQDTPPQKNLLTNSLEEIITTQESPAPLLPPWAAESRPFSPTHFNLEHPWAESNRCQEVGLPKIGRREHVWSSSHEVMWSSPSINDQSNKLQLAAQLI